MEELNEDNASIKESIVDTPLPVPQVVTFIANLAEVRAMLDAGYTIRAAWLAMRTNEKTTYSYDAFRCQVKRNTPPKPVTEVSRLSAMLKQAKEEQARRSASARSGPLTTPSEPKCDITLNPKAKDLI